jgi:hypothetical protein
MLAFTVSEWHQVTSNKMYEVDEDELIEVFGSVNRFIEIMSWQDQELFGGMDQQGEEPTDEEYDMFWEFVNESDYDREDDWWSERKGGYDVTVKLDE